MAPATAGGVVAGGATAAVAALAAGGQGWVEQVRALRSVADVNRLLHEASARERAIDAELEQLLARRGQLEQRLVQLHASTEEVRPWGGEGRPRLLNGSSTATSWPAGLCADAALLHSAWPCCIPGACHPSAVPLSNRSFFVLTILPYTPFRCWR